MTQSLSKMFSILEEYDFKFEKLSDRLRCIICGNILINASQTLCGCKACHKCIKNYLQRGPRICPSNQPDCAGVILNITKDINQDNATNREIGNLREICPLKSCKYENLIKNLVEHMESCEFREITCEKCSKKFIANKKMNHDQEVCEMRDWECSNCKKIITIKELNGHLDSDSENLCSNLIDFCPNKCSVKQKVNLKIHLTMCVNKKLVCPFKSFACEFGKMTKEDLTNHIHDEFCHHFSALVDKSKDTDTQVEKLMGKLKSHQQIVRELHEVIDKLNESRINMEKSIEEVSKKGSVKLPTTVDKNQIFRNGTYIWKFTDFESKRLDAENGVRMSITSDPFFTSEFGYKMCLRIYPAGDGVGTGTHLSVFFAIMKGDYDDLLSWPFKQKVTLSIFDLETGTKHHLDTFKPDSNSACYQKPSDDMNVASGSPTFVLLSLLTTNDSIYCKNDTIYIKISVDPIGLPKP